MSYPENSIFILDDESYLSGVAPATDSHLYGSWTSIYPPETQDGEYVRFVNGFWVITTFPTGTRFVYDLDGYFIGTIHKTNIGERTDWTNKFPPQITSEDVPKFVNGEWEVVKNNNIINDLLEQVNIERERRLEESIVSLNGIDYDANQRSRDNITGVIVESLAGVPIPWPIDWRCADNITRALSMEDAVTVSALIMQKIKFIYSKSWDLKDNIIPNAETLSDIDVKSDEYWT